MAYLMVKQTVEDYAKWKPAFDEHGSTRKAAGSKGAQVFQSVDEPNEVTVLLEWDSVENARKFSESTSLREVMQKAGVLGRPSIAFMNEVEKQSQ